MSDTPSTSRWTQRAALSWIVLVLLVWCFHFRVGASFTRLERRAPVLAALREALDRFFSRPYVF